MTNKEKLVEIDPRSWHLYRAAIKALNEAVQENDIVDLIWQHVNQTEFTEEDVYDWVFGYNNSREWNPDDAFDTDE